MSATNTTGSAPDTSTLLTKQWPKEVIELFEPVRKLGKGGFGSVLLARKKKGSSKADADHLVAIKVVGSVKASNAEIGYAHREIDILKELSHPNIVRIVDFWELEGHATCAAVIALEYIQGPTLESLLKVGGALSSIFSRTVSAQLCNAVAFLHSHGVIHRDLKPDNVIVTGAAHSQDEIWDDDGDEDVSNSSDKDAGFWAQVRAKWHVTLIDFGFARAFGPDDLQAVVTTTTTATTTNTTALGSSHGRRGLKTSLGNSGTTPDQSITRKFHRKMSALGNRNYAAPEIIRAVTERSNIDKSDATQTISHYVSDYGMLADAYSLGLIIRYMATGVAPHQNFDAVIAWEKHPVSRAWRWLKNKVRPHHSKQQQRANSKARRKRKLRVYEELPSELVRLIMGMTYEDSKRRTTARAARRFPWIADVLDDWEDTKDIQCLEFTKSRNQQHGLIQISE